MAERQSWPAWRYGPSGEAQIFAQQGDVPEGWKDHPSKLGPAPEKLGGDTDELARLREENERLQRDWQVARDAYDQRASEIDELREARKGWHLQENAMHAELVRLREELQAAMTHAAPPAASPQEPQSARRGPRKLSAVPSTPVTPQDDTITLDEGREERLKVLRDAGITIGDDATDGDIEEALDWLEKQPKKG